MLKRKTLGMVIRDIRKNRNLTLSELAEMVPGYDIANLSRFERGQQGINLEKLRLLCKALQVSISDVYKSVELAGEGDTPLNPSDIDTIEFQTNLLDKEVSLPYFTELTLTAGEIMTQSVLGRATETKRFKESFLTPLGVTRDNAFVMRMYDNNMVPVIPVGAQVAVNTRETRVINSKTYAINHTGLVRLVMLYNLPGGGFRLVSHNAAEYPEETYNQDVVKRDITVLGRAFWYSTVL